jgi:branched-subunit amino acid transport protein AzlD
MTAAMGAVIFFCRVFPFLFFRKGGGSSPPDDKKAAKGLRSLVEKAAPPVTMTVLAVNAMSAPIRESLPAAFPVLAASLFTALVHLWKRNSLLSIMGGTAIYMALSRVLGA